jgi:hypothetical protein
LIELFTKARSERSQQKRIGLWTKQRINLGQEFVIGGMGLQPRSKRIR